MQQFSSRIGGLQLIEHLTALVHSAADRLAHRQAAKRTEEPMNHPKHNLQHNLQAELEQKLEAMHRAFEEQSLLLRMVVHDLRMPLTSIQGYTDMLRQGMYGPLAGEQQSVLMSIAYSTQFLDHLVKGLLDTLSAETGSLSLAHEPFDPCQLARKVLEDCYPQAVRQGLTLRFHSASALPMIVGDPDRVRQMLFNLLGNALRYTSEGCITLTVQALADVVEFRVEDTGVGIATDMQAIIWKPFIRANGNGEGLGLGLYTVQRLTEAMGGSVGLHSTPGTGSVFWIRLPYQELGKAIGDNSGGSLSA